MQTPELVTSTLAAFTSRCSTPRRWQCCRASLTYSSYNVVPCCRYRWFTWKAAPKSQALPRLFSVLSTRILQAQGVMIKSGRGAEIPIMIPAPNYISGLNYIVHGPS